MEKLRKNARGAAAMHADWCLAGGPMVTPERSDLLAAGG
jgi:hypothetical protein